MINDGEVLAIMKNVGIGMRDTNNPCLWFDACIDESGRALQVLSWKEAQQVIKESDVYDVKNLEGKACIVDISTPNMILFVRVAKI